MPDKILTLRLATARDAAAIARLAEMEEAQPLVGDSLLAELDGAVVAAVSVRDGRAVADIFRPTADIVRMLRARREQLIGARGLTGAAAPRWPGRVRRLLSLRQAAVPA